jgi:hypothetical protein
MAWKLQDTNRTVTIEVNACFNAVRLNEGAINGEMLIAPSHILCNSGGIFWILSREFCA